MGIGHDSCIHIFPASANATSFPPSDEDAIPCQPFVLPTESSSTQVVPELDETQMFPNLTHAAKSFPSAEEATPWEGGDAVVSSDAGPLENVPRDDGDEMVENEIAGNEGDYHNNNNVNYESEEDDLSYLPRNFGVGGVSPRSHSTILTPCIIVMND